METLVRGEHGVLVGLLDNRAGTTPLSEAYEEAQRRKQELQSDEAKLARLQNGPVLVKLLSAMLR